MKRRKKGFAGLQCILWGVEVEQRKYFHLFSGRNEKGGRKESRKKKGRKKGKRKKKGRKDKIYKYVMKTEREEGRIKCTRMLRRKEGRKDG